MQKQTSDETTRILLEARAVVKKYRLGEFDVKALDQIRIQIREGEFLALAGSSGSGKTTLLNLLGGIDRPSEGDVFFEEVNTRSLTEDQLASLRAKKIGFVFQTFNLIPVLSALENVEYPLLLLDYSAKERRQMALEALCKVGLEQLKDNRPAQMSGGQRQRVAIARALVKRAKVILADEPTANLDRKTGMEILDLMEKLNTEEKVTLVLSSHDPAILSRVKRVFRLQDGQEIT